MCWRGTFSDEKEKGSGEGAGAGGQRRGVVRLEPARAKRPDDHHPTGQPDGIGGKQCDVQRGGGRDWPEWPLVKV